MSVKILNRASIGQPITRLGASIFPVYLGGQAMPFTFVTGITNGVIVTEKSSAEVPTLQVTNKNDHFVLIPEGNVLDGGRQTRIVNVSILVGAQSTIDIPVSCVEAGRWGGGTSFRNSNRFANRRVRRSSLTGVHHSIRTDGSKSSDQGAVWEAVDYELNLKGVRSPSANFRDIENFSNQHRQTAQAIDELVKLGPLPGQQGVIVAHSSRIVNLEVFATDVALAANWEALVRGIILDAPGKSVANPSATSALEFLNQMSKVELINKPGVGLGTEEYLQSGQIVGQSLSYEGALVHASAFALAA